MRSSGLADSPFFQVLPNAKETSITPRPDAGEQASPALNSNRFVSSMAAQSGNSTPVSDGEDNKQPGEKQLHTPTRNRSHRDAKLPRHHATVVSRYHDAIVELIRAAVKQFGKEAATHRFTAEEKKAIADIVYTYKRDGVRTSENEITRIAVNFVLADYGENGDNSILAMVLKALNG